MRTTPNFTGDNRVFTSVLVLVCYLRSVRTSPASSLHTCYLMQNNYKYRSPCGTNRCLSFWAAGSHLLSVQLWDAASPLEVMAASRKTRSVLFECLANFGAGCCFFRANLGRGVVGGDLGAKNPYFCFIKRARRAFFCLFF